MPRFVLLGFAGCALALLSACGGGGGSSSTPTAGVGAAVTTPASVATSQATTPAASATAAATGRRDNEQVERHALVRIDDVEPTAASLEPVERGFAGAVAVLVVDDKRVCALRLAMVDERLERVLDLRVDVGCEDHAPADVLEVVGVEAFANGERLLGRSFHPCRLSVLLRARRFCLTNLGLDGVIRQVVEWLAGGCGDAEGVKCFRLVRHRAHAEANAADQIACATSGPAMSLCAPLGPSFLAMNCDDSRL